MQFNTEKSIEIIYNVLIPIAMHDIYDYTKI